MHPYYLKLNLELSFDDWRFLNYLAHTYVGRVHPYMYNGQEIHSFKDFYLRASDKTYKDNILFQKIANLFVDGCEYNSSEWIYNHSQIALVTDYLPIHFDKRNCVISIPLVPIVTPIQWFDSKEDGNVLYEYYYDSAATLVNTKLLHGSPDNVTKRIFFQVGGIMKEFDDVLTLIK